VIPFFAFPPEVRKVIYTTSMIESINFQLRKITKTRGTSRATMRWSSCSTSAAAISASTTPAAGRTLATSSVDRPQPIRNTTDD
jgi:putative transposase